jgi:hypothetical protein
MKWLGCPLQGVFKVKDWICLTNSSARCSLASQLQTTELHATWCSIPLLVSCACVRAWLAGQSGFCLVDWASFPLRPNINPSDLILKWFFMGTVQRKSANQIANTWRTGAIHSRYFCYCPARRLSGNGMGLCLPACTVLCKMLSCMVKCDTKLCENCSNIAFCWSDAATERCVPAFTVILHTFEQDSDKYFRHSRKLSPVQNIWYVAKKR